MRLGWIAPLAALLASATARADPRLDLPAPPSLPSLSHAGQDLTTEWMMVGVLPNDEISPQLALAWVDSLRFEASLDARRWFIGVEAGAAGAMVQGIGSRTFFASPEIHVRGLWSSLVGLAAGGGVGVVAPLPQGLASDGAEELLRVVRTVRPWDAPHYVDLGLTIRPFVDVRYVVGPVLFQLRQGLDWTVDLATGDPRADLATRTTLYVGARVDRLGFGVEAWEVYELTALDRAKKPLPDEKRASFALSPNVRLLGVRGVEPALSVLFPIVTPLRGEVDGFFAVRLDAVFRFGS